MSSPDALHLRFAAAGQLRRPADTVAARPEDNNAFGCPQVSLASGVVPVSLCQCDALPLAFAAILEVVSSHLQGELQQHFLNGLEHDLGNAVGAGRDVAKIHHTRYGKTSTLIANCFDQLFSFRQRQTTDTVYLLRNDNLDRLKVRDETKQLRPVGASAGCLLAVDAGDVVPGIPRLSDDRFLAIKILPLRTDPQINTSNVYIPLLLSAHLDIPQRALAQNSGKRIAP